MEGAREHRVAKTGGPVALSKEEWPLWSPSEAISMTRSALQEGTEELPVILDRLSEQGWDTDR